MDSFDPVKIAHDVVEPSNGVKDGLSPIILLHGMTSSKEIWNHVAGPIADGMNRKVYRLDMRNHGDSDRSDIFDYQTMAEDVDHFMEDNNIQKAIVIGHSMGGKVAMALASMKPEKVEKLIIEDISPVRISDITRRYPFMYLKLLRESLNSVPPDVDELTAKTKIYEFMASRIPENQRNSEKSKFDPMIFQLRKTGNRYEWKANLDVIEANFFGPLNPRNKLQGSYSGKSLFIYGTKSTYNVIESRDKILDMFPNASFHAVEGATHLVHMEYPEEFVSATLEFLK